MNQEETIRLVEGVVTDLFTTGHTGEFADRLALMKGGRDLGGWGQGPVKKMLMKLAADLSGGGTDG